MKVSERIHIDRLRSFKSAILAGSSALTLLASGTAHAQETEQAAPPTPTDISSAVPQGAAEDQAIVVTGAGSGVGNS